MFRKIADALAVAFHPVFMGTIVLLLMSLEKGDLSNFNFVLCIGYILFFGLFIPVAGTYLLYKDIHLHQRHQRFWPLIISFVSHLILLFLLKPFYQHKALMCGAILMCINMLVLLVFTVFMKASMHANAMAIVMALFAIAYTIVTVFAPTPVPLLLTFTLVLILFGIITWQRYNSKAHTVAELLAGFLSGFISVGLMLLYIDSFGY